MNRSPGILVIGVLLLIIGLWASSKPVWASEKPIYQYTNTAGSLVFTDDLSGIPEQYRSSVRIIEPSPALKLPDPPKPPALNTPSWLERAQNGFSQLPFNLRLTAAGIIPLAMLTLWALWFFRKRAESPSVKLLLRLGMLAIVILTAYLCYFLVIRTQAEKWMGPLPSVSDLKKAPQKLLEPLKKQQEERFKRLEDIADQK